MKRLRAIEQKASRLVNQTVLDFYGIKLNPKKDLANLDKVTIHAIKQAMIFAVTHRYPDRVLLYPTYQCAVYCRHCFRKESLSDANDQFSEELLRRTSHKAIVPLDRDPVPPPYSEKTRRYYERLGTGK